MSGNKIESLEPVQVPTHLVILTESTTNHEAGSIVLMPGELAKEFLNSGLATDNPYEIERNMDKITIYIP